MFYLCYHVGSISIQENIIWMTSTHSEDGKYAFGDGKYAPELWEVRIGAWEVRIWIHNPGLRHV